jgi:tetratricopeptide (TPR) repeat protein
MGNPPPSTSDDAPPSIGRAAVALVLVGTLFWVAAGLLGGSWEGEYAPVPYVWRDVAIVHLVCCLPLAWVAGARLARRLPAAGSIALAAGLLTLGAVSLAGAAEVAGMIGFLPGVVLRSVPALCLATAAALVLAPWVGGRPAPSRTGGAVALGLGLVASVLLPALYVGQRCQHDVARLGELLDQSRFGEARALAGALTLLDAGREWNGRPLPRVAEDLDRLLRALEASVAVPLAARATAEERLERARRLAMLGRTDAAVVSLKSIRDPAVMPAVHNLLATIHENRGEWDEGLESYRTAAAGWQSRPASPTRADGLLRAAIGVAYCQRKLGRYAEAEVAYLQVLALSPTAATHFLLAQFYEDAQDAAKARWHARQAMALDPAGYRQEGEKLVRKLAVFHFGCLGVFSAEAERSAASLAPGGGSDTP